MGYLEIIDGSGLTASFTDDGVKVEPSTITCLDYIYGMKRLGCHHYLIHQAFLVSHDPQLWLLDCNIGR